MTVNEKNHHRVSHNLFNFQWFFFSSSSSWCRNFSICFFTTHQFRFPYRQPFFSCILSLMITIFFVSNHWFLYFFHVIFSIKYEINSSKKSIKLWCLTVKKKEKYSMFLCIRLWFAVRYIVCTIKTLISKCRKWLLLFGQLMENCLTFVHCSLCSFQRAISMENNHCLHRKIDLFY